MSNAPASLSKKKSGYLPSLDGWRAIAILGVIMQHDTVWHLWGYSNERVRDFGGMGVWLFFAISGLLICGRILEDEAARHRFDIKAFYIRRLFRIQPAAWAYLAVIAILVLLGIIHERWHFWVAALLLYQNFTWHELQFDRMLREGAFTGHFWTLAVEEHFYILLSAFLYFCKRYRIAALAVCLVILTAAQKWAHSHGYFSPDVSDRRTYFQIQYLLFPALFALILRVHSAKQFVLRYLRPWVAFALTALLLLANYIRHFGPHNIGHPEYAVYASRSILYYCFTLWVAASMLHPSSATTRVLEWRPLRYLGRISYSLYLWHVLFFASAAPFLHITWAPLAFSSHRPWRYLFALGAAMASYHLLEKPLMRLGHRLAPPATAGHADLGGAPAPPAAAAHHASAAP